MTEGNRQRRYVPCSPFALFAAALPRFLLRPEPPPSGALSSLPSPLLDGSGRPPFATGLAVPEPLASSLGPGMAPGGPGWARMCAGITAGYVPGGCGYVVKGG